MPDAAPAPLARFHVTPDNKLIDRVRGCETRVCMFNTDPPGHVSLSAVMGWLNKLAEERGAFEDTVRELQERLDINAQSPQSPESMQRKLEDLQKRFDQAVDAVTRLRLERDEVRKAYSACAAEIASLAGNTRELERLRGVHAAYVKGARNLLGEKANTLEAEVDIPEMLPPDLAEIANAARLSEPRAVPQRSLGEVGSASGSAVPKRDIGDELRDGINNWAEDLRKKGEAAGVIPPAAPAEDPLPPVEDNLAGAVLADRRQTLLLVQQLLVTRMDRFTRLQASLRLEKSARNLPREAVFSSGASAVYGMAMMAVQTVLDTIHAIMPEDPTEKAVNDMRNAIGGLMGALAGMKLHEPRKS